MGAESSSESSSTLPAILPARGCLLCFDFGIKRIGVATGELETSLASPLTIISHESRAARFGAIARLVQEWRPVAFVVGWPRPLDDVDNVHVMNRIVVASPISFRAASVCRCIWLTSD